MQANLSQTQQELIDFGKYNRKRGRNLLSHNNDTTPLSKKQKSMNKWEYLPLHIMASIFSYFRKKEIIPMGRTCNHWWRASRHNLLWRQFDFSGFQINSLPEAIQLIQDIFSHPSVRAAGAVSINSLQHSIPVASPIRNLSFPRDCLGFTIEHLSLLRRSCPELVELQLPSVSPTRNFIATESISDNVLEELVKMQNLKKVNLATHVQVTDAGVQLVALKCKQLHTLTLDHCPNITCTGIIEALRSNPSIRSLSALCCTSAAFSNEHLVQLAQYAIQLEEVSLDFHSELETDAVSIFASHAKNLRSLHIRGWKLMDGFSLSKICQLLQSIQRLTFIGTGSTKLISPLIKSESLRELSLNHCELVKLMSVQCPNLNKLCVESVQLVNELHVDAPRLKELVLRSIKLENTDLSLMIKKFQQLREIDILHCAGLSKLQLQSNFLEQLTIYLCTNLTELHIECERLKTMTVDECMELKKAIVVSPALEKSDWFTVPQPQFPAMNTLLLSSKKLQSLSLQRCINLIQVGLKCEKMVALNLADCKHLEELQLTCPNLEKLALSAPRFVFSLDAVQLLASSCPRVHMLSISNAPFLVDEALTRMCTLWTNLQALVVNNCEALRTPLIASKAIVGLQLNDCANLKAPVIDCPSLSKLLFKNTVTLCDDAITQLSNGLAPLIRLLDITNCPGIMNPKIYFPNLMTATFTQCMNIKAPVLAAPNMRNMIFVDCPNLDQMALAVPSGVQEIVFQNCRLSDTMIEKLTQFVPQIDALVFIRNEGLVQPSIASKSLKSLQFTDCARLQKPIIMAPSIQTLLFKNCNNLNFSSLQSEIIHPVTPPVFNPLLQPPNFSHQQSTLSLPPTPSLPAFAIPPPFLRTPFTTNSIPRIQQSIPTHPTIGYQQTSQQQTSPSLPLSLQPFSGQVVRPRLAFVEFVNCGLLNNVDLSVAAERLNVTACSNLKSLSVSAPLSKMAVSACQRLTHLKVNGSSSTELIIKDCPELCSFEPSNVRAVACVNCPMITDKNVEQFTQPEQAQHLRALLLDSCGISSPSIRHQELHVLKVNNHRALVDLHTELPALQTLDVQNCQNLSMQFIMKLNALSNFHHLRHLVLKELHLTEAGLGKLLSRISRINMRHLEISCPGSVPLHRTNQIIHQYLCSEQKVV